MARVTIDLSANDVNDIVLAHIRETYNIRDTLNDNHTITVNWLKDQIGARILVDEAPPRPPRVNPFETVLKIEADPHQTGE